MNDPGACNWTVTGKGGTITRSEQLGTQQVASDAAGNVLWKEQLLPYGGRVPAGNVQE